MFFSSFVSPNDLHATMLCAVGLDAKQLVYNHHGLRETPVGVTDGRIVYEVFV